MTLINPAAYNDVEVKVHTATEDNEAVPLVQLKSLITKALRYKGPCSLAVEPAKTDVGDVYVFDVAGIASWLGNKSVALHEAVFWDGTNWDLMGSSTTGGAYVVAVKEKVGNAVKVDSTNPANPIVTVDLTDVESQLNAIDTKADNAADHAKNNEKKIDTNVASIGSVQLKIDDVSKIASSALQDIRVSLPLKSVDWADHRVDITIDDATDQAKGVIRIATDQEAILGADATLAINTVQHHKLDLDIKRITGGILHNNNELGTHNKELMDLRAKDLALEAEIKKNQTDVAENASHVQDLLTEFNAQHLEVQRLRLDVDKNKADINNLLSRVTALEAKP